MFAKFKIVWLFLTILSVVSWSTAQKSKADNVLNGQNTANVQLVLDNTPDHEVYVEIFDTFVRFWPDGEPPMVSYYNNTFASLTIEVVGGPDGNHVVVNDLSTAYLDVVDVHVEFDGGDGQDNIEHGINMWSQADVPSWVTDFPCTIYGNGGLDFLDGANGNDYIDSGSGMGFISGGPGNDILIGGDGLDSIYGNEGNDTIDGGNGWNYLYGGDDDDDISGGSWIDTIEGGDGDDTISGGAAGDKLYGDDGNDTIRGGAGNDKIFGGDDDDNIKGESGLDEISGDGGNDVLDGAGTQNFFFWGFGLWYPTHHDSSNDILIGGEGEDWFKNYMHWKPNGPWMYIADLDAMMDYNPAEGDIATVAVWEIISFPFGFKLK